MSEEKPITFTNPSNCVLHGVIHHSTPSATRGVVIVVGGPQTRVGSHRQFVLLARYLARQGIPSLRFDYQGMGDSGGSSIDFESASDDIKAATDEFFSLCPALQDAVIWGLCDAASAAMFYAHTDGRVRGLVLANPWVRTDSGMAKAYLKNYYLSRLKDPELWDKVRSGKFNVTEATKSLFKMASSAIGLKRDGKKSQQIPDAQPAAPSCEFDASLPDRMANGLEKYNGRLLFIISGDDLTAAEFTSLCKSSRRWRKLMKKKSPDVATLADANHTFSSTAWRNTVAAKTTEWIKSW